MHDSFLFNKISEELEEICVANKIKKIDEFTVVVNHDSHIHEENLSEYLRLHNANRIDKKSKVVVERGDIESQTAIIKTIEGETFAI